MDEWEGKGMTERESDAVEQRGETESCKHETRERRRKRRDK